MGKNWDKFLLLTWKNWLLQWRHPIQTVIEILAPVLFSALLVLMRSLVDPETREDKIYTPFDISDRTLNTSALNRNLSTIAFSPCGNEILTNIMNNVSAVYPHVTSTQCLANSEVLESVLWNDMRNTLVGVQFDDSLAGRNDIDRNMTINLRFPSELRWPSGFEQTWRTTLIFPLFQVTGPRDYDDDMGAAPRYLMETFLPIQYDVSKELIKYFANEDTFDVQVSMARFPYPSWIEDPLLTALQTFVGLIFMLSFVYTCINTVKVITTEKERQLKESMKIMGLPNWLHWLAWFLKVFVLLLVSIILMVVLLNIPWYSHTDNTIFTLADPFLIFVFLMLYACATITFCFAISVFFSKANTATTIAGLAWFLSYVPYAFMQDSYASLSLAQKLLGSLLANTAMAFGFQLFIMWEGTGEGLTWSTMFSSISNDDSFTLAHVMLMLIVDAIIYLLIALYVEAVFPGEFGVPEPWYFPFTRAYWCGQGQYIEATDDKTIVESDVYEKEPSNLKIGIQLKNLRKVYPGKKVAVQGMALNIFENQITVLLGHNGAGKTTTMSMLTGMITPTSGTAIVNGYDIQTNITQVRDSLGLCPQHNILFDELTVAEHIYFFSKLKGLRKKEIDREIDTYVELLDLVPKRNERSSTLSGGMKRKLCVAMAMCGKSKICMLDEPTAGMDPAARRALWDMIQKQKKDRTILLTTHFMDEADLLGDRIAIMAGGQLQCYGTGFFLKKKYGAGYHLIMDKMRDCNVKKVTELLRVHIPNIESETNVGSELTYILPEDHSAVFEKMLSDLENNSKNLQINSYGISLTTMEEVFMKVGADHGQEEILNGHGITTGGNHFEEVDLLNNSSETRLNVNENYFLTGFPLWRNQFIAMLMKKVLYSYRSWILTLIQNVIPIFFMVLTLIIVQIMNTSGELTSLEFTLDSYNDPVTVVTRTSPDNNYSINLLEILNGENRNATNWENGDMVEHMLNLTRLYLPTVRMSYILGFSFEDNSILTWFNNEPYHSPPLALQYTMNTILQQKKDASYSIRFINDPLPLSAETRFEQINTGQTVGFQIAFNLAFCMSFVSPFYILFYVRERANKSKHLQFVSGAKVSTYWIPAVLWDYLMFIITLLIAVITLVCFQEDGFSTGTEIGRTIAVLFMFALASLPVTYLFSYLFVIPSTGYTRLCLINIFLGCAMFMVVQVLSVESLNLTGVADALHYIFLIVPHYAMATGILSLSNLYNVNTVCAMIDEISGSPAITCMVYVQCCDRTENYFDINQGVGFHMIYMSIVVVVGFCLLMMIEYRLFDTIIYSFQNRRSQIPTTEDTDDSDVLEEKRRVRNGEIQPSEYNIVLKDLTKYYSNFLAVNQLCLGIKGYECFGLLGINGAGKTSTFKMMTGDVIMSSGNGWIYNLNLKTDMKKVNKHIGYCPQFDALLDDMTGKETLIKYCLLRGIPLKECSAIAEQLSKDFDFHRHINKLVKSMSGGTKRKLSAAVALIGDPPIIFLDEPTAGMDPATKRNLWNTLCKIRDKGKCLVLTSHSMEECEALCTRLAIMVNGAFKCLGSTQHLKNKFSEGYMLIVKIRKSGPDTPFDDSNVEAIDQLIKTNFPSAILKESHQELMTYFIPDMSVPWSKMFGIMERGKREIPSIEDYSLGQSSLEQVFLLFTKLQREE